MNCTSCRACSSPSRPRLIAGRPVDARAERVVALAGNPNTGKSTVFNALTGLRQHTGNWPGKTVARAEGRYAHDGERFRVVDLPGTYSLLSTSTDEEIARDFLLFGRPDAVVIVIDATAIERNLGLALQVTELSDRVVVCLNLMDEALRKGIVIDAAALSRELGVPVVPTAARNGEGLDELRETISAVADGLLRPHPTRVTYPEGVERALTSLVPKLRMAAPGLPNLRWLALRLLDGDASVASALVDGRLVALAESLRPSKEAVVPTLVSLTAQGVAA